MIKMLITIGIIVLLIGSEVHGLPAHTRNQREIKKKAPAAVASLVTGKENDKYAAKTKNEEERALKKEQREDLFEGDVVPSKKLQELIAKENKTVNEKLMKALGRDVLSYESMRWKSKTIPYLFDAGLSNEAKSAALSAFQDFATYTCVRFVPRTNEADYIRFFKGSGCYSYVGRNGGAQDLSIGAGCEFKGTVIHESMHALGFFHEHTRLDRDNYVKIIWDNIKAGLEKNFQKYASGAADYLGQPYDFNSIMHYPERAFAKDPTQKTIEIVASVSPAPKIGQRDGMSEIDIKQIRKLFNCDEPTTVPPTTTAPVTTNAPVTTAAVTTAPGPTVVPGTTTKATLAPVTNKPTTIVPGTTPGASSTPIVPSTVAPSTVKPSPTQPAISVERTTPQTTQPIVVNPGMGNGQKILIQIKTGTAVGTYPQWPTDFSWNTNGVPQTCNSQPTNCQCVHMNEPSAGAEWKTNYLCYKKRGDVEPAIEWSYNGEIEGKRCTHISDPTFAKYWENNFLCVPKDSPYHFVWSFRGPVKAKDMSCLRMGVPGGPKEWLDNYLCGKISKNDEEDV